MSTWKGPLEFAKEVCALMHTTRGNPGLTEDAVRKYLTVVYAASLTSDERRPMRLRAPEALGRCVIPVHRRTRRSEPPRLLRGSSSDRFRHELGSERWTQVHGRDRGTFCVQHDSREHLNLRLGVEDVLVLAEVDPRGRNAVLGICDPDSPDHVTGLVIAFKHVHLEQLERLGDGETHPR